MLGIAIHCIQHFQAMLERGVCELAHSFIVELSLIIVFVYLVSLLYAQVYRRRFLEK